MRRTGSHVREAEAGGEHKPRDGGAAERDFALSLALLALAGGVDAIGYLRLNGVFVSFMSGNSTRLSIAFVAEDWRTAARGGAVLVLFVMGAAAGRAVSCRSGAFHRAAVLIAEAALLGLAAIFGGQDLAALALLAFAMGLQNAAIHQAGEVKVSLTYVTGTLVKLGEGVAETLLGMGGQWKPYALMWCALAAGGIFGAFAYGRFGPAALACPAAGALALALAAANAARRE